jgi:hypothetical protein
VCLSPVRKKLTLDPPLCAPRPLHKGRCQQDPLPAELAKARTSAVAQLTTQHWRHMCVHHHTDTDPQPSPLPLPYPLRPPPSPPASTHTHTGATMAQQS